MGASLYAQDEYRLTPRLTLNYGLRYERINPFTEVEDRLNAFVPGVQSEARPDAPVGLLFPGDRGCPAGSRRVSTRSCRAPASRGIQREPAPGR